MPWQSALPFLYSILLSPHPLPGDIGVHPTDLKPETELSSWPTDLSVIRTAYFSKPPHEGVCMSLCAVEHSPGLRCSIVPPPPHFGAEVLFLRLMAYPALPPPMFPPG